MRLLAIGDIHGCHAALTTLWKLVNPSAQDQVVFLGDYVDRGLESRAVLDFLIAESAKPGRIFLRGNHEVMMLDARDNPLHFHSWLDCGGRETLASYGLAQDRHWPTRIPESHWRFLEQTARGYETEHYIFVHACLHPDLPMDEQSDDWLYWETFDQLRPHQSRKKIVCGHTLQRNGRIAQTSFAACIETGVAYGGWLTCLDVESGDFWQSTQTSGTRAGNLLNWKT